MFIDLLILVVLIGLVGFGLSKLHKWLKENVK